jgi:hypothetical protein
VGVKMTGRTENEGRAGGAKSCPADRRKNQRTAVDGSNFLEEKEIDSAVRKEGRRHGVENFSRGRIVREFCGLRTPGMMLWMGCSPALENVECTNIMESERRSLRLNTALWKLFNTAGKSIYSIKYIMNYR